MGFRRDNDRDKVNHKFQWPKAEAATGGVL